MRKKKRVQRWGTAKISQPKQDTDATAETQKEIITFAAKVAIFPGASQIGTEAHGAVAAVGVQGIGADRIGATRRRILDTLINICKVIENINHPTGTRRYFFP